MQPSRFVMVESAAAACELPRAAAAYVATSSWSCPPSPPEAETGSSAAITTHKTKRMMYLRFIRSPPGKRIPVRRITYFGLILNWTKVQPAALMSALPPKADMCSALVMSALCQKRTSRLRAQLVRYWLRRCSPYNAEGVCRKVSRPNTTIPAMKDNGRLIYINPTSKKIANDDVWGGLQKRLRRR